MKYEFQLNIDEKLKTQIDGRVGLNVYKLSSSKSYPLFFAGQATSDYADNTFKLPYPCRNLILTYDSSATPDKLYFSFDGSIDNGYILQGEAIELNDLIEFSTIYIKGATQLIDFRLWVW